MIFILLIALIGLIVSICTLCLLTVILYRTFEQDMNIFPSFVEKLKPQKVDDSKDTYTPTYANDSEASLENFEPDFNKPLKVKIQDKEEVTEEEIHPLTTSDIMHDPDEPQEELK